MKLRKPRWLHGLHELVLSVVWPWERQFEKLWKEQGGVTPDTNECWLTPRMLRKAKSLERLWEKQDRQND